MTTVVTCDPALIKATFCLVEPGSLEPSVPASLDVLVGEGSLMLQRDEAHRRIRRLLTPTLCRHAAAAWVSMIEDSTRRHFTALARSGEPFDLLTQLRELTMGLIVGLILGAEDPRVEELSAASVETMDRIKPLFLVSRLAQRELGGRTSFGRYMHSSRRVDAILRERIQAARRDPNASGMLASLMREPDEHGQTLTDQELLSNLRTVIIGGHESSSVSLTWALHYLHRDPALLATLRDDLDAHGARPGLRGSTSSAGRASRWARATIDEALRIRPITPQLFRGLRAPMSFGRWTFPAGVTISPATPLLHLREDLWPDPERFDPTRFFGQRPSPDVYIPYGGGVHRCIGGGFASVEMVVILATILVEFELEFLDHELEWARVGLALQPRAGARARAQIREHHGLDPAIRQLAHG